MHVYTNKYLDACANITSDPHMSPTYLILLKCRCGNNMEQMWKEAIFNHRERKKILNFVSKGSGSIVGGGGGAAAAVPDSASHCRHAGLPVPSWCTAAAFAAAAAASQYMESRPSLLRSSPKGPGKALEYRQDASYLFIVSSCFYL